MGLDILILKAVYGEPCFPYDFFTMVHKMSGILLRVCLISSLLLTASNSLLKSEKLSYDESTNFRMGS